MDSDNFEVVSRVRLRIQLMAESISETPTRAKRELDFMRGYIAGLMVEGLLSRGKAEVLTAEAKEAKKDAL